MKNELFEDIVEGAVNKKFIKTQRYFGNLKNFPISNL